jgi:hypothetical protein
VLFASALARADVVTLPATKDATIFNDGTGAHASGTWKEFFAGMSGTNVSYPVKRAVIEFDVAGAIRPARACSRCSSASTCRRPPRAPSPSTCSA